MSDIIIDTNQTDEENVVTESTAEIIEPDSPDVTGGLDADGNHIPETSAEAEALAVARGTIHNNFGWYNTGRGYELVKADPYEHIILPRGTQMTPELLGKLINRHRTYEQRRAETLELYYRGKQDILTYSQKEPWKPDNRLVVNIAKYIVDTYNGYFMGIPAKVEYINEDEKETTPDVYQKKVDYLKNFNIFNGVDDHNAELSKYTAMQGHCYEMLYTDALSQANVTYFKSQNGFVVYDDAITRKPMYGVHYYTTADDKRVRGSFSDMYNIYYFEEVEGNDGGLSIEITEGKRHFWGDVPILESVENEEIMGVFEGVITEMNELNKAVSEKANDVDYFADAYLVILGADVDKNEIVKIRDDRVINVSQSFGQDNNIEVKFLDRPNSDASQENLINRLEKYIFQLSMIVNLYDERNTSSTSGAYLEQKTHVMSLLASVKERKFTALLQRRYRLLCQLPNTPFKRDDWLNFTYSFTRNLPDDTEAKVNNAVKLKGTVSEQTLLEYLPDNIVDDAEEEMKRIQKEAEALAIKMGFPNSLTDNDDVDDSTTTENELEGAGAELIDEPTEG